MWLLACIVLLAVPTVATDQAPWVPTTFLMNNDVAMLQLHRVNMQLRASDPARYPMFKDLPKGESKTVSMDELEKELKRHTGASGPGLFAARHRAAEQYPDTVLDGAIMHESRCGSTLGANSACVCLCVSVSAPAPA